ncbi:hypothetical protein FGIG_06164 [Fasciola gigantica]|uniref:Uncharacterized protein n=1 Tax=Fasciola gigantica TaxID=46835 RepID=A0A504Z2Q3_FASGI|nr:hypothetical protein FGIG_06164 [Fasciola gigantica]
MPSLSGQTRTTKKICAAHPMPGTLSIGLLRRYHIVLFLLRVSSQTNPSANEKLKSLCHFQKSFWIFSTVRTSESHCFHLALFARSTNKLISWSTHLTLWWEKCQYFVM